MTRTETPTGARYTVRRPDWAGVGYTLASRMSVAILGALAGTIAIGQGWL